MPTTTIYYTAPNGGYASHEAVYPDGGTPPTPPPGTTPLTEAEYNAAITAVQAARATTQTQVRAAEDTATRLRHNAPARLVAAANAPASVKETAAYVCDGVDDQVQVNQALNDTLAAGGGKILLSAGLFLLNDSIKVPPGGGLTLEGVGWGTVLKNAANSNRYAITFTGPGETRACFQHFKIDGNYLEQTGGGGIWAQGAVQCRFDNLHLTACYDTGIYLGPVSDTTPGHANHITNVLFDHAMGSPGTGVGVCCTGSDENVIIGCDYQFMGGNAGVAAGVYDQAGKQRVLGCNFTGGRAGKPAVRIQNADHTKVVASHFTGVGSDGILVSGSGCTITSNTFLDVGIIGPAGQASGVHLEFAAQRNVVSGNVLATHTVDGAARALIREDAEGGAGQNLITANQLVQHGTAALGLLSLDGAGSTVRANAGAGTAEDNIPPVRVVAGPVTDGAFPANRVPPVGTLAYDSTSSKLYVRTATGVWKSAAVA